MAKEASTSDEKPKSLHVVCAPGGGAFSVYMFLRYTLAQLSHPQISDVKLTMFCQKKKGKPFDAEVWWKRWSNDKTLTDALSVNVGWKPLFIDSTQASNKTNINADIPVFILAGGDRSSLVDVFQQTHLSNQNATLKTEHEIVSLEEKSFFFHSAYDGQILRGTDTAFPLTPEEAIHAVESAESMFFHDETRCENLAASGGKKKDNSQWSFTCNFDWILHPSFNKNDPSRIQIQIKPSISSIKGTGFSRYRALKVYLDKKIVTLWDWRKSFRLSLKVSKKTLKILRSTLKNRLVDFEKLISKPNHKPSRYLSKNSMFFFLKGSQKEKHSTLIWLPWDRNNVGRSVQLLSLVLYRLKPNECVLLTSFYPSRKTEAAYSENLFLQSLLSNSETSANMWTEGLEHIETKELDDHDQLISEIKGSHMIELYDIGINGPSLKESIDFVYSQFFLRRYKLSLVSKRDVIDRCFNAAPFIHSDRSFVRGAFSLLPKKHTNEYFKELNRSKLQKKRIASHLVWLHSFNNTMDEGHWKPLAMKFCALDEKGKLTGIDDNYHTTSLEIILYLALERYRNRVRDSVQKSTQHDIELLLPDGDFDNLVIDPELWMSVIHQSGRAHAVFDAKTKDGVDAKEALDADTTNLLSKYSWQSLVERIPVYSFSYFEGGGEYSHRQPHMFSYSNPSNNEQLAKSLYSIDLFDLACYMTMFLWEKIEQPKSYADYSENCFSVEIPRHESSALKPNKNQIGIEFFRKNYPALKSNSGSCEQTAQVSSFSKFLTAIKKFFSEAWTTFRSLFYPTKQGKTSAEVAVFHQHYSGFFYNKIKSKKIGKGFYSVDDDAFHFYDEPLTKVMRWALLTLGLDEFFEVQALDSTLEGASIRITDEENKEWLISIPDFLTISDLSNLRRFLNNKEGFNHYHAFKPPSRRDKKKESEHRKMVLNQNEEKNLLHRVMTQLPFMKLYILALREKGKKSIPMVQDFNHLSTIIREPILEMVSAVSMFQKMGCEAFDTAFLTALLEANYLERELNNDFEETLVSKAKLQQYCIDSMFQLNLTSATLIESIDEEHKAIYLHDAFHKQKFKPVLDRMPLKDFRKAMQRIVHNETKMFVNNPQTRYDAFREELVRRSSQSSQSDA